MTQKLNTEQHGGFFDFDINDINSMKKACTSRLHNPPQHLYIPAGKGYRHICPSCGQINELFSSEPIYKE